MNQLRLALLTAALLMSACAKEIGDGCSTNSDCAANGTRICDVYQPGGYCTIDGCNDSSCPEEAVCIRYFGAEFLGAACDPACIAGSGGAGCCAAGELCLPQGRCAPLSAERRFCARSCGNSGDCRDEYECVTAGTRGTLAYTPRTTDTAKFCLAK